jgi:hypothetical protein
MTTPSTQPSLFERLCEKAVADTTHRIALLFDPQTEQNRSKRFLRIIEDLGLARSVIAQMCDDTEFTKSFARRFQPQNEDPKEQIPSVSGNTRTNLWGNGAYNVSPYTDVSESLTKLLTLPILSQGRTDIRPLTTESVNGQYSQMEYCALTPSESERVKQAPSARMNFSELAELKRSFPLVYAERAEKGAFKKLLQTLAPIETTPDTPLLFLKITSRFQLDPNQNQMVALSQFVAVQFNHPSSSKPTRTHWVAIHQDPFLIEQTLDAIGKIFEKIVSLKQINEQPDHNLNHKVQLVGQIRYLYAHAMPWTRGSASIGEMIETSLMRSLGVTRYPVITKSGTDLDAYALPYGKFLEKYTQTREQIIRDSL